MTDTKGNSSFKVNHKATEPWVSAIGKLMVNFGAIELATYAWIDRLAKDRLLHDLAIDMPLAKRLEILDELVERQTISDELKRKIKSAWGAIARLSKLRNAIAHNPLIFGWHGSDETRPPDFIGLPDFKKLKRGKQKIVPLRNLKELNAAVSKVLAVAHDLESYLSQIEDTAE